MWQLQFGIYIKVFINRTLSLRIYLIEKCSFNLICFAFNLLLVELIILDKIINFVREIRTDALTKQRELKWENQLFLAPRYIVTSQALVFEHLLGKNPCSINQIQKYEKIKKKINCLRALKLLMALNSLTRSVSQTSKERNQRFNELQTSLSFMAQNQFHLLFSSF